MGKQLIFIDDSGDPGFKLNKGSSQFFIIVCVIFDSKSEAESMALNLELLKSRLGWKKDHEFKFHRTNDKQKKLFFDTVKKFDFKIRAIVVDKAKIKKPQLKNSGSFYSYTIQNILDDYDGMSSARIFLDGSGSKNYRKKSTSRLRQAVNKNRQRMVGFKLVDSKDNILIQVADMIAGAIHADCDKLKRSKYNYLRILKDKIDDIQYAKQTKNPERD